MFDRHNKGGGHCGTGNCGDEIYVRGFRVPATTPPIRRSRTPRDDDVIAEFFE
jgi:hypothetical protein